VLAFGWSDFKEWFHRIWTQDLGQVGDHAVEVNQIVFGIIALIIGLWISRRLSVWVRKALIKRTRVDESVAAAVHRVLYYVLFVIVVLFSLQVVGIPLTIFAFLGGAVAIGLGFGAQNIFNNFISGLLLLMERPVRVGDFIQVDDSYGRVEEIRYRCARIRRSDGIDVLVPNSRLIEQNVVNWTLVDRRVRAEVRVGVVYGSDTALVRELALRAANEHDRILKNPEPWIVYEDFGDNALIFDIYFWVDVRSMMELRRIQSDVRFGIDAYFREAGIVIAFPQRDVHIDSLSPLEIKVVPGERTRNVDEGASQ
jgi:small-conductance mechanosensitive channel